MAHGYLRDWDEGWGRSDERERSDRQREKPSHVLKGPPGTPCPDKTTCVHNTNDTGALDHANSACAASGLNDMDPNDAGQTVSIVQTAADSWKFYGLPKGAPGTLGLCVGGTGE